MKESKTVIQLADHLMGMERGQRTTNRLEVLSKRQER
jgi:hypothetical protein